MQETNKVFHISDTPVDPGGGHTQHLADNTLGGTAPLTNQTKLFPDDVPITYRATKNCLTGTLTMAQWQPERHFSPCSSSTGREEKERVCSFEMTRPPVASQVPGVAGRWNRCVGFH